MKKILAIVISAVMIIPTCLFGYAKDYDGHWAESSIDNLVLKKVISGDESGNINPDNNITRAEFAKIVNRYFGYTSSDTSNFKDVSKDSWYYDEFLKAKKAGYITGDNNGFANPEVYITREEVCTVLSRILKLYEAKNLEFTDSDAISSWAKNYVSFMVNKGYISGYPDKTFRPRNFITRAEAFSLTAKLPQSVSDNKATGTGNVSSMVTTGSGKGNSGGGGGGGSSLTTKKTTVDIRNYDEKTHILQFTSKNAEMYKVKFVVGGEEYEYTLKPETLSEGQKIDLTDVLKTTAVKRNKHIENYEMYIEATGKSAFETSGYIKFHSGIVIIDLNTPSDLKSGFLNSGDNSFYKIEWGAVSTAISYRYSIYNSMKENASPIITAETNETNAIIDMTPFDSMERSEMYFTVSARDKETNLYSKESEKKYLLMEGPSIKSVSYNASTDKYDVELNEISDSVLRYVYKIGSYTDTTNDLVFCISVPDGIKGNKLFVQAQCDNNESVWKSYDYNFNYGGGNGTNDSPYILNSQRHLKNIDENTKENFKLINDIDLSADYIPLNAFSGVLDGDNHKIKLNGKGLCKTLGENAVFINLILDGKVSGTSDTGALANVANKNITVTNCINNASVSADGGNLGGFFGSSRSYSEDKIVFNSCVNNGSVISSSGLCVGGFIGKGTWGTSFEKSQNNGKIIGSSSGKVGGFSGWMANELKNCANFGSVSGYQAGGFIGVAQYCSSILTDCLNAGEINGPYTGGILGNISSTTFGGGTSLTNVVNLGSAAYAATGSGIAPKISSVYFLTGYSKAFSEEQEKELSEITVELLGDENWYFNDECEHPLPIGTNYYDDSIKIASESDLMGISSNPSEKYKLISDIELTSSYIPVSGFKGMLNGGGYTITLNGTSLFSALESNATISNLVLDGYVTSSGDTGALAASANDNVSLLNCVNKANVISTGAVTSSCGGFFGTSAVYHNDRITFKKCVNLGNVTGETAGNVGGMIGKGTWNTTVDSCVNKGNIKGDASSGRVGGFVGWMAKEIKGSANFGTNFGAFAGGLIGVIHYYATSVGDCANFGDISGTKTGGVVGTIMSTTIGGSGASVNRFINIGTVSNSVYGGETKPISYSELYSLSGASASYDTAEEKTEEELKNINIEGWKKFDGTEYPLPECLEYALK